LQQTDLRRLLAWSSIAHAGYMLVGLTAGPNVRSAVGGLEALLFYLAAYGAMTVGAFAVLVAVGRGERRVESIDDLAGMSQTHPVAALLMTVFLFSLTGLPPTAGFLGKLNLFLAAWSTGTPSAQALAVLLAVNAAIGAWYYLRLIGVMYLNEPRQAAVDPVDVPASLGVACCAIATIGLFAAPNLLWPLIERIGP
ncbi:MAG: NADH-quinone oxidoreductase subunit N, partial [Planctomycetaceae bacterium]